MPLPAILVRFFAVFLLTLTVLARADWGEQEWGGDDWEEDWGEASTPFDAAPGDEDDGDPWEGFNRRVFAFNEGVDRYAAKPLAQGYDKVTPSWTRRSVSHFFSNLKDFRSGISNVLQWQWGKAGHSFGRFTVNSTLGVAGFFDVASQISLERHHTDLGRTLLYWGVPDGPYLMLPFLGPSTVLDTATFYPERLIAPLHDYPDTATRYGISAFYALDVRAGLLGFERAIVGDRYTFIRNAYLQQRRISDDGDWDGFDALESEFDGYEDDDGW